MSRYLDPKADIVFKKIFSDHPKLLKSFLNAVLPLPPGRQIVELKNIPPEQVPIIPALKRTVADVRCTDNEGRAFVVEVQIEWADSFKQRLLFGAGQSLVKQLEKGEYYHLLQPVYGLGIIGSIFDKETPEWYHHYQMVKAKKTDQEKLDIIEYLQLIFVELPKFPVNILEEGKKLRILWLRFLREIDQKTTEVSPDLLAIPEISKAIQLAEEVAYTKAELEAYESYWKQVSSEKSLMHDRYTKGKAEGRAEGKAEEKFDMAKKMCAKGATMDFISDVTGLNKAEIKALVEQGKADK